MRCQEKEVIPMSADEKKKKGRRWKYYTQGFGGNMHETVDWINEHHPEWDVVTINIIAGSLCIVLWREEL